jgi:hypothetical protein
MCHSEKVTLSITMLCHFAWCRTLFVIMLNVINAECHYAECHHAECHYAESHYAECLYAECHYAECHYAECHHAECHYAACHYAECRGTEKMPISIPTGATANIHFGLFLYYHSFFAIKIVLDNI